MLTVLRAENLILIDALELSLGPGLNVITGETGAGKSILVGALHLVLGERASPDVVRVGAEAAEVEALFSLDDAALAAKLSEQDVPFDGELCVRRVIGANGRSRAYLNGKLCSAAELQRLAPHLANIASQHESVSLTDPATHVGWLDRFARLEGLRAEVGAGAAELERLVRELSAARDAERGRAEREAFLDFQLGAIDAVGPRAGERAELEAERSRLRHATRLEEGSRRAAERLDQGEAPIADELARIAREVTALAALDPSLSEIASGLEGAFVTVRELGRELGRYAERAEADPGRLSAIEERLFKLEQLLRQHGPTEADVVLARERLASERERLAGTDARIAALEATRAERLAAVGARAKELSARRKEAAAGLGASISGELAALGMGGARIEVEVAPLGGAAELAIEGARLSQTGIDRVEFLIAPNKGAPPRPLRKIASGGELSRALLALQRVLASADPTRALYVFDEVDTGVGGAVAEAIGRAIADVARHHQVLCITHLAPIAAFGGTHFVVSKQLRGEGEASRTVSQVSLVRGDDRVREVARMLAGAKITQAALDAAAELVAGASEAAPKPPKAATSRRPTRSR